MRRSVSQTWQAMDGPAFLSNDLGYVTVKRKSMKHRPPMVFSVRSSEFRYYFAKKSWFQNRKVGLRSGSETGCVVASLSFHLGRWRVCANLTKFGAIEISWRTVGGYVARVGGYYFRGPFTTLLYLSNAIFATCVSRTLHLCELGPSKNCRLQGKAGNARLTEHTTFSLLLKRSFCVSLRRLTGNFHRFERKEGLFDWISLMVWWNVAWCHVRRFFADVVGEVVVLLMHSR